MNSTSEQFSNPTRSIYFNRYIELELLETVSRSHTYYNQKHSSAYTVVKRAFLF